MSYTIRWYESCLSSPVLCRLGDPTSSTQHQDFRVAKEEPLMGRIHFSNTTIFEVPRP